MSWFYLLEKRLVDTLLRSPTFTKGVQNIHKRVHTFQHGKPPEYHDPTHLDTEDAVRNGGVSRFFKLFWDELKSGHRPEAPSSPPLKAPPPRPCNVRKTPTQVPELQSQLQSIAGDAGPTNS